MLSLSSLLFSSSHVVPLTINSKSLPALSLTNFPWLSFSFFYSLELFFSSKENNSNTHLVLLFTKPAGSVICFYPLDKLLLSYFRKGCRRRVRAGARGAHAKCLSSKLCRQQRHKLKTD